MEIEIIGNVDTIDFEEKIVEALDEVMTSTADRLQKEQGIKITGAEFTKALFTIGYFVEGMEDSQLLTVEHHTGVPEMFKWVVDLDKEERSHNEDVSAYDPWTVAMAKGEQKEFETVETIYVPEKDFIDEVQRDEYGDMSRVIYEHTNGNRVVQVLQKGRLIQEYTLIPKEDGDGGTTE